MSLKSGFARKKVLRGCLVCLFCSSLAPACSSGPVIRDLMSNGLLHPRYRRENAQVQRQLHGEPQGALQAMSAVQESEGGFPDSAGWMDSLEDRIKPHDMTKRKPTEKFHESHARDRPKRSSATVMNDLLSKRISGTSRIPQRPRFSSTARTPKRNAHGSPQKLLLSPAPRRQPGVSAGGSALRL